MKYEFIKANKNKFDISKICSILGVRRSSYYSYCSRPESQRKQEDKKLLSEIKDIYKDSNKLYGELRIHAELQKKGIKCGHNRVGRLKRENNIYSKRKKKPKHPKSYTDVNDASPNLLNREFKPERPNQAWASDITYIPHKYNWLYLCTVLDLFNKEIVGWSIADHMRSELVVEAIEKACKKSKPEKGLIFHSDQGSQYSSHKVRDLLKQKGMRQSMSRRGNCWDNACAESFFHTLKSEHIQNKKYSSLEEAELSIFEYIEGFYNTRRLHSTLGYKSPIEFKKIFYQKLAI